MKIKFCMILPTVVLLLNSCSSMNTQNTMNDNSIKLQKIITEIQSALSLVSDNIEKETNLKFDNASLQINAELKKSVNGSADFWVISGKAGIDNKTYDKISVVLVPVKQGKNQVISSEKILSIHLANAIISAAKAISNVNTGKYPLMAEKLDIEMGIVTTITGSIDTGFNFEILPLSISETGKYSRSNSNVLKIEFSRKK